MKTTILALAAFATLGMVPAVAQGGQDGARGAAIKVSQDFSSSHRHNHWRHNGWRRHHWDRHCTRFWRHGRLITVCR